MSVSATKAHIARGVQAHLRQLGGMSPWQDGEYERESYSGFCIAMQILGQLYPEMDDEWTHADVRQFALECGVTQEDAQRFISDNDSPLAIY